MTVASDISGQTRPETDAALEAAGVGTWRWRLAEQRVAHSAMASAKASGAAANAHELRAQGRRAVEQYGWAPRAADL